MVHIYLQSPGEALIKVMTSTVQPESWEINGGDGTIEEFNGLLVVRASQEVHHEIKNLLEMMREAALENHGRKKAAPTARRNEPEGFKFYSSGGFDPETAGDFGTVGKPPLQISEGIRILRDRDGKSLKRNVPESVKQD